MIIDVDYSCNPQFIIVVIILMHINTDDEIAVKYVLADVIGEEPFQQCCAVFSF